jgi:4-amino-4-deoxy-L-arabinose transferase-like glycosyltransferase
MWAVAAGIALGTTYTLSPIAVWFVIAIAAVFLAAIRGLDARERQAVVAILVIAVLLRVAAIVWLALTADPNGQGLVSFAFDGDGRYMKLKSVLIRHAWLGVPIDEEWALNSWNTYGWSSYLLVMAYLHVLIGPSPFAAHLVNIALMAAASAILYRTMRWGFGSTVAVGGLALLMFMPTMFFWSISAMKESFQLFLAVVGLAATIGAARARHPLGKCGAVIVAILAIAALDTVRRDVALAIGLGGTGVGLLAFVATRRIGLGLAGLAVVGLAVASLWHPAVQPRFLEALRPAAEAQIGNVNTPGHSYKLLDEHFYWLDRGEPIESIRFDEAGRYIGRALVSFVTTPLPWQVSSKPELAFLPVQVFWYVLVGFALMGVGPGFRKDPFTTCLLCGYIVVGATAMSVASGNIGTFVRHRDNVTPYLVWLSLLGIEHTFGRMAAAFRDRRPWPHVETAWL